MQNPIAFICLHLARHQLRTRRGGFYFDLGATLQERVPLITTLRKYESRARKRNPLSAPMYMAMLRGIQGGSLSQALAGVATPSEQTLIDATQGGGDVVMAEGLLFMSDVVEKTDKMVATMRKAALYPLGLLTMFGVLLALFALKAVPVLAELMPPAKWPASGQVLYSVSTVIAEHGLWMAAAFIGMVSLFTYSLSRWTGPLRTVADRFLPYSLYRDYAGSMLLISLSSMMRAGVSLRSALERTLKFASPWTRWHVRRILSNLSKPNTPHFGQAFSTGVLNRELEDRVQDASERRDPVDAFVRMGAGSIDRMVKEMELRSARLNSMMLLVCGLVLGMFMLAFFSTTMGMQAAIRDGGQQINNSQTP
jgi:type II secretory pathway component PulF